MGIVVGIMAQFNLDQAQARVQGVIQKAMAAGAQAADVVLVDGSSLSVSWRGGKLEALEQSEGGDLGVRVFVGQQQASVSTTDQSERALTEAVERAVAMAKAATADPFCGLADPSEIARVIPQVELADDYQIDAESLIALAREAEAAALAVPGVTQCESADAGAGQTHIVLAASNGFSGAYSRTHYGIGVGALAGSGTAMEQDGEYVSTVFQSDLPSAASIGKTAGERAVGHLGSRKMPSCQAPVLFDPRESGGLIGAFANAILGSGVARGTSFLKEYLGKQVFAEGVTLIDDPFRARGLRSKVFDGEGVSPQRRTIVENGVLTTWLMDLRSARQLGLKSTGHASRGTTGVPSPSPTNLYLEAGTLSPDDLMRDIKQGFYVTETMGMGVNGVTGDYSLAARGFWIENGQRVFPVNEMTIAGNLKEMFRHLTPANDLTFRYGIDSPTIRIENMTIAGI